MEIIVEAYAVKYSHIDYEDGYVVVQQNRTRRRVYDGYYFDDNGEYLWVSSIAVGMFQHKKKARKYLLDKETKEWKLFEEIQVTKHIPGAEAPVNDNIIESLKR